MSRPRFSGARRSLKAREQGPVRSEHGQRLTVQVLGAIRKCGGSQRLAGHTLTMFPFLGHYDRQLFSFIILECRSNVLRKGNGFSCSCPVTGAQIPFLGRQYRTRQGNHHTGASDSDPRDPYKGQNVAPVCFLTHGMAVWERDPAPCSCVRKRNSRNTLWQACLDKDSDACSQCERDSFPGPAGHDWVASAQRLAPSLWA